MAKQTVRSVFIRPLYFVIAAIVVAVAIASVAVYRRANPPPIQFRSETAVAYKWTVNLYCDGVHVGIKAGHARGSEMQSVKWPDDCDRVLVQVYYTPTVPGCTPNSPSLYITHESPPLTFRVQCYSSADASMLNVGHAGLHLTQ